jgi:type IV secretion system protein VirB7
MRLPVLTLLAVLALSGCASTGGGKLAVCDGKHLRPANPYGSVLTPTATGQAQTPAGAAVEAKPRKLSSAASSSSFGSCA